MWIFDAENSSSIALTMLKEPLTIILAFKIRVLKFLPLKFVYALDRNFRSAPIGSEVIPTPFKSIILTEVSALPGIATLENT